MSSLHTLLAMLMSFQLQLVPMSDQPTTTVVEPPTTQGPGDPVKPPPKPEPPKKIDDATWSSIKGGKH